jgi:hypothetical protein
MKKLILPLLAAAALTMPAAAAAQATMQVQPISGTRLDISATGEVTRVRARHEQLGDGAGEAADDDPGDPAVGFEIIHGTAPL